MAFILTRMLKVARTGFIQSFPQLYQLLPQFEAPLGAWTLDCPGFLMSYLPGVLWKMGLFAPASLWSECPMIGLPSSPPNPALISSKCV